MTAARLDRNGAILGVMGSKFHTLVRLSICFVLVSIFFSIKNDLVTFFGDIYSFDLETIESITGCFDVLT